MAEQGTTAPVDPAGAPAPIDTLIREAAARHGVPADPLLAIVQQESHGDPNAFNPQSGARGIAQFIPDTARRYGIDPNDPAQSADAAARMFADNLKRFGGDASKAIAAHFGGTDEAKWGPKTRKYVDEVTARIPSAAAPPYRGDDSGNRTPEPKLDQRGAPVPEDGWTTFMPTPAQAAPEDDGNILTDSTKLLAKGAANIGTTIGQGLTYAGRKTGFPGMQAAGETIRDLGQNAEAHWHEALSPSMRQALDNPLITEDFQLGDTPLKTIYANTLEMLPSLAAMGGTGGLAMKGFEAVGAATRVARLMEGMGAPAAAVEKATGYVTRGAAFGGSQALYMSLQAASSAEQQVKAQGAQDPAAFDGSEAYRQAYANTDPRLPDAQRRNLAMEQLSEQVGDRVFTRSLALNGAVGMLTGGGIFNEWGRNLAKGGITRRAASAGVDAGILTPQMVGQQLVGNEAQQLANPDYPMMTGVPNAAAMGLTTGAMFGAAMGGKPHEPTRTLTPPRAEPEVSGKTERAPIAAQSVPSEPTPREDTENHTVRENIGSPSEPATSAPPRPDMGEKPTEAAPNTENHVLPSEKSEVPAGVDPETGEIRKPLAPGMLEGDIGRKDGTPFKNPFAAQNALRKLGLEETHSVAPIEGGGFAIRAKPPRTSLDESAHQAATSPENDHPEPTENEKKAGNYLKGHDRFAGMEVSFENPAGSVRKGVSRSGKPWENTMQDHYGYIRGTVGKDKDHIDAFWKPGTPKDFDGHVFVVDQRNAARGFDEHKVIFGASSREDAEATYRRNYTKNWKGMGALTEVPMDGFKAWLKNGDTKQPFAPQAEKFVHTPAAEANGYAKPLPGHATELAARHQAEVQSATSGQPHVVIEHPSLPGQFAVVPERRVASTPHTPERRAATSEKSEASSENSAAPARSAKQQARDAELRRIAIGRRTVHPDKDSLIPAIIKMGGIGLAHRADILRDPKATNPRLPFVGTLFRQHGLGLDEMATALHERRYLSDADLADVDGGVQKVRDLIERELGGEKHYSTHADMARVAAEKYGEQPHAEVSPAEAQAEVPPEAEPARDAVADEAYAAAEAEVHNRDWAQMTQSERDAELDSIFGAQDHEVHTGNPDQARGPDAGAAEAGAGSGSAAGEGENGEGHRAGVPAAEGFDLAGHDRAELERRDAERVTADAAKAQADAAAETRAKADAERDQFTLAGSDRSADTAAARGQGDLLSTAARIEPAKPPAALEEAPKQQGPAPKIEDFGEKIGGARKDVAKPLGSRPKIEAEPDQRPAWARKYIPMPQVVRSMRGAEAGLERTGKWTLSIADKDGHARPVSRQTFDSEADALAAIPLAEVSRNHRVNGYKDADGTMRYGIFRTIGDRKRALVKGGFESEDAALRHLVQHAPDIIEHKFAFPERPWLDKIERVGEPKRTADVSPKQFQEQFGFRAGEFGNWNMGGDGQAALNHAFDALHDLADTLGVPAKALSLDGKLAIAFGARGHGGKDSAAAHYERDRAVINLTKIKGAGSLAHEWFHALDHYLGGQAGKRGAEREDAYLTYGPHYKENHARPELLAAFKGVVDAMTAKKHGVAVDENQAQRAYTRAQESVKRHLDDLRQGIASERQYGAKKGAATAEQLEKWDALAKRALAGDPGADVRVAPPKGASRMSLGYGSSEVVRGLNELYKAVTGRSFDRADETSEGRRLHWSIRSVRDMNERVAKAQAGTVEERKTGTEYLDEAKKIDSFRASNYWSTPHEMGARAFESYIFDKLAAGAKRSDYLTHAVENKYYALLGLKPYPEGAERTTINTAFDHLFKAIQSKETDQGTALFSRASAEQRQTLADTFRALGEHHEFFQMPKTARKTVKGIAHDMDPRLEVLPGTVPSHLAHLTEDAYTLYDPRNGAQGSLYVSHDGKVELDVQNLKHGQGGGTFYQVAATFAHNNGLKFIGDRAGFSLDAMYRRTEHMLSSALRHGTTDHVEPHPDQTGHTAESFGLRPIDWRPGEHDHNVAELLLTSLSTVERRLPEIKDLSYDFVRHEFTDTITGRPVDDAYFNELASSLDGRAARAGRNTIARAIVAQSVLREAGSRGRDEFLAEFRRLTDQHFPRSLEGRAYSRAPTQARPGAGLSVSDIQSHVQDISKAWANGPRVHVVAAPADLPFHAPGDARGAFHNGQVYLVASNLPDAGAVQFALFHEAKGHYGLRGLLGEQLTPELTRLANVNQNVRKAAYDWRADNPQPKGMSDAEYRARSIEEALSDLAGSAKLSGVQRFVAAVQKGLRAIGLTKVADWLEGKTDAEALSLLGRASKYVEEGEHAPLHAEPAPALSQPKPAFVSELARQVATKGPGTASGAEWRKFLDTAPTRGVKADEIEWSGVKDWLALQDGKVSRDQVETFLRDHGVRVEETVKGEEGDTETDHADQIRVQLDSRGWSIEEDMDGGIAQVLQRGRGRDGDTPYAYDTGTGRYLAQDKQGEIVFLPDDVADLVREYNSIHEGGGGEEAATRYGSYTLPGGENYRELLLTLPENQNAAHEARSARIKELEQRKRELEATMADAARGSDERESARTGIRNAQTQIDMVMREKEDRTAFRSGHFDEPNILAHVRFKDRTDADGKRVLFLEEVQSDWAQKGRREGFGPRYSAGHVDPESGAPLEGAAPIVGMGVPHAPFVQKTEAWTALALKRMIRYAADHGYDRIAWTTGEQQAERYDLSKQLSEVHVVPMLTDGKPNGEYGVDGFAHGGSRPIIQRSSIPAAQLADVIGKDLADRAMREIEASKNDRGVTYKGLDLKVGGEGMKAFYDKLLPNVANDLLKKFGGERVGQGAMKFDNAPEDVVERVAREQGSDHPFVQKNRSPQMGFDITPALRERAQQGLPLFSRQKASMAPGEEAREREPLPGLPKVTRDDFVRGAKDLFKSYSPLNWWDKTLATQRQKAEKSPLFKAVWDKARAIEKDTSQMAMEAAERAPGLLPLMKDWKDAFKGRVGSQKARDAAGRAIYEGTLHDQEVYSDAELKQRFEQWGVSDKDAAQATELYREALAANNRSLDDLHASIGARIARLLPGFDPDVIARAKADPTDARGAYDREFLRLADAMERMHQKTGVDHVQKIRRQVSEVFDQNEKLKREGYFPLMRFGKYAVYARDRGAEGVEGEENQGDTDKKPYFGLFENKVEAERMRRALTEHYDTVTSGEVSKEAWRSMEGLSPETVRMFASAVGMDESEAFKDWIRLALANHSAMKRLLPRKGIPGFDTDPQRTLAHFITSNARAAARNYHMDDMMAAEQAIPKSEGRIKDEAVKLTQYLRHPEADAAGLRSLMFTQYIGGSIASAMVNLTQPVLQTAPYLSRYGEATKYLAAAFRDGTGALAKEADVRAALARADREGVTSPHELYQLYNESIRGLGSSPAWVRFQKVWGGFFAVSEQFNRRITFSAAFRMARDGALEKINEERVAAGHTPFKDAYAFAEHAVEETQSVYSKANRPNWGRGAIGASLLTFKQFTIQYLEFLTRLPRAQQGVALALLVGGAGVQGLPFAQNLEDLIDTIGQGLGWNTNSHEWMRTKAASVLGKTAGDVLMRGVSAIPGSPIDVSQRIGLGNIVPGMAMFKPSEKDKLGQLLKWAGVPGSTAQTVLQAGGKAVSGDAKGAGTDLLPNAVKNAYAGFRMATTGQYDSPVTGKPIMKVSPQDALAKGIGFQPYDVAAYRQTESDLRQDLGGVSAAKTRILDQWARAQAAGDTDGIKAARAALADWNKKNPDTPISINGGQLSARVRALKTEAPERLIKAAPKQLRGMVRQSLADTHPTE